MSSVNTLHNRQIPWLPDRQRTVVWLPVGQAVFINDRTALSLRSERQVDSDIASAVFTLHTKAGAKFNADSPESLLFMTSDAVVRVVESNDHGPVRALVEIGDMAAYPHLRECAA